MFWRYDLIFFFPPHLFPRLSVALTVLLGSLKAHDGHEGQKSRAQVCLGRGGEATGGRRVRRGFRQELNHQVLFLLQSHEQCMNPQIWRPISELVS